MNRGGSRFLGVPISAESNAIFLVPALALNRASGNRLALTFRVHCSIIAFGQALGCA